MRGAAIDRGMFLFAVLCLALAACGSGGGAPPPPTGISTFAYVMNECEAAPGQGQGPLHQVLWIRQGERDPVKVAEFTLASFPRSLCLKYGQTRSGEASVLVGAFQRLAVMPDGSNVVFEVTDDFWLFRGFVAQEQKGFFVVGADGNSEVDRGTGSIVFDSSCDPFGTNPYGSQAFAMRPDRTGLRQLTSARGLREGGDGSLAVELPGPLGIASRYE